MEKEVPEPVLSAIKMEQDVAAPNFSELVELVELVALKRGMIDVPKALWVEAVVAKLEDVGIKSVHNLMRLILTLNNLLSGSGHL
jgi:hypothetical protein